MTQVKKLSPKPVGKRNRRYPEYITSLKKNDKLSKKPFIVGDIETILYDGSDIKREIEDDAFLDGSGESIEMENKVHSPYACGLMVVRPFSPGEDVAKAKKEDFLAQRAPFLHVNVDIYYSSDHPEIRFPSHFHRSVKLMKDFVNSLRGAASCRIKKNTYTVPPFGAVEKLPPPECSFFVRSGKGAPSLTAARLK